MKQVKIFSESSHSALEDALNDYLRSLHHSDVVKSITYNFPNKADEFWKAVVEIDWFGGKPVFWASNNKNLERAVELYGDGVKPPFVVRIPDHATTVESAAFADNENIGIVMLPHSVTRIGSSAFFGCSSLLELFIPNSVTKISGPIANCVNTINVDPSNPVYDSRNDCNAIIETATNTLINGCSNTKIPDSVTKIADNAFDGYRLNIHFKIPKTICEIGEYAFAGCQGLNSIRIPDSVSMIKLCTFADSDISSIYIPNSVNYIDSSAFQGCGRLTDIHIKILNPNNVQFGDNNDCFDFDKEKGEQYRLYVPNGTKTLYENHPAFNMFDLINEE